MVLSVNCVSSQGVSRCDRVLVGPVKETCTSTELFDIFVARHVGDTACSQVVERCSFFNLQKGQSTSQLVQCPSETPVEIVKSFDCNAVRYVLFTVAPCPSAERCPSAFRRSSDGR